MKRVLLAFVSTVTGLVMLLSFKTHAVVATRAAAPALAPTTVVSASPIPTAASTPAPAKTSTTRTVTGTAVDTKWGPVQVKITVANGTITSAVAVDYPTSNGRDQEINAYAVPTLEQETVAANSATIDMVSGATYTSRGYISSLQSALNQVAG